MPKLHDEWQVLPHGPVKEISPGLLTVVGQIPMPLGNFPRRMFNFLKREEGVQTHDSRFCQILFGGTWTVTQS